MPILRRLAATLTGLCLLQLTLLGGSVPRAMTLGGSGGSVAAAAHAMIGMAGMHETASSGSSGTIASSETGGSDDSQMPLGCDEASRHHGCSLPGVPGQCATMTSCATPVARSGDVLVRVSRPSPADAPRLVAAGVLHSGPVRAPELPPPRA